MARGLHSFGRGRKSPIYEERRTMKLFRFRSKGRLAAGLLTLVTFTPAAMAEAILVIDDFGGAAQGTGIAKFPGIDTGPTGFSSVLTTNALGGERDLLVQALGTSYNATLESNGDGLTLLTATSNSGNNSFEVQWDGLDNSALLHHTGLNGVDLIALSQQTLDAAAFSVFFVPTTVRVDLTLNVYTDALNWSSLKLLTPLVNTGSPPVRANWKFADFVTQAGAGADFTDVGAITMTWTMNAGAGRPQLVCLP
jgi:hypothetical protein